jgi:hypothetical protein
MSALKEFGAEFTLLAGFLVYLLHPPECFRRGFIREQFVFRAAEEKERLWAYPPGDIREIVLLSQGGNEH